VLAHLLHRWPLKGHAAAAIPRRVGPLLGSYCRLTRLLGRPPPPPVVPCLATRGEAETADKACPARRRISPAPPHAAAALVASGWIAGCHSLADLATLHCWKGEERTVGDRGTRDDGLLASGWWRLRWGVGVAAVTCGVVFI
jgi:hypothetical protein